MLTPQPCLHTLMQTLLSANQSARTILVILKKHLCNIQIRQYIANKKIKQNSAQMKYKWPVTAIKPLKNKLFNVTSNPSTLVYLMSSMIQFHSWLNLLTASRLKQT